MNKRGRREGWSGCGVSLGSVFTWWWDSILSSLQRGEEENSSQGRQAGIAASEGGVPCELAVRGLEIIGGVVSGCA